MPRMLHPFAQNVLSRHDGYQTSSLSSNDDCTRSTRLPDIEAVAATKSVCAICQDPEMPCRSNVMRWVGDTKHPEF